MTNALPPLARTAPVQEIFSSIQGEGIVVGHRQIFVRFAHCHLHCAYCDTPMRSPDGNCHIEYPVASGQYITLKNPVSASQLIQKIADLAVISPHHSVSFTGGEPLLYASFLQAILPEIQMILPTYLETSGTQPQALKPILPWLNWVAMDIKLPSATKEAPQYEHHAAFYQILHSSAATPQCFIKLVYNTDTTIEELEPLLDIVTDRETPIILQPETDLLTGQLKFSPRHYLTLERFLAQCFKTVRLIPQTHKMLHIL